MQRWGQIGADVNYARVADQVFLATDASRLMHELGMQPPLKAKPIVVMGKTFDPAEPRTYLDSFAIKRV
jgi:nitrate/nitrite transport system substrate-binding protein